MTDAEVYRRAAQELWEIGPGLGLSLGLERMSCCRITLVARGNGMNLSQWEGNCCCSLCRDHASHIKRCSRRIPRARIVFLASSRMP